MQSVACGGAAPALFHDSGGNSSANVASTVAVLATEERGTHRLLHAALRRAFRRVEFVRRSTVRRCLARAEVDTAPADWMAVAVCRGVR